ncbi:MAG: LysR family transcriptional regulator [Proteobacteria bacterium]|nr:LysR family transcriptional regulator [Pseudomonadota bacterium]
MTLVQLKHFIALAETGSFSKAAELLHLTQPALSRSVRALEDELGLALFDRIGRHSEVTPFGRDVLERAQGLVLDAGDLRESGRLMRAGQAGSMRVGMASGPGAILMTPLLMHIATNYPNLRVRVSRGGTELLLQALRDRTLDAVVLEARSMRPATDLQITLLRDMRGAIMCRKGHPLARKRKGVDFNALRRYPIASTPLGDEISRELMERYGPDAHPSKCVSLECEELPSLVDVVRRSNAVLLAIRAAAPDLVEVKMEPALNAFARFGLITLRRRSEPPALPVLKQLMDELMQG